MTSWLLAGLRSLLFVYCSQMNQTHLSFIPIWIFHSSRAHPPGSLQHSLGTTGVTRHAFLVSPPLSLSPILSCFTCKTTSATNACKHCSCYGETNFQVISKKTSVAVLFSACGRVRLIPRLLSNHVSIKVKSCFLWSKSPARHIQLLRAGGNSKNVLATEMRWKPTNMLSQSGTRDKRLVPNLPPPLTSASDLMAQPVFPFKMSHQGAVNTSISQWAPGNTR